MGKITSKSMLISMGKFSIPSIINFIIGFVAVILLTRFFSPEVYGIWNLFNATATMMMGIASMGMGDSFIRFSSELPSGWSLRQLMARCMGIALLCWFFMVIVFVLYAETTSLIIFNENNVKYIFLLLLATLALLVLNRFLSNYYRITNQPGLYSVLQVSIQFVSKLAVLGAIILPDKSLAALTIETICLFVLLIAFGIKEKMWCLLRDCFFSFHEAVDVIKFGIESWPVYAVIQSVNFLIPWIIVVGLDKVSVGLYSSTNIFCTIIAVLTSGFSSYWSPFMYRYYQYEQKRIMKMHNYILILSIFLLGVFILCQHFAYLFIGDAFQGSRSFFSLVVLNALFLLLSETTGYGISIHKKVNEILIIWVFSIFLLLIVAWFLMPVFNILGVAMAVMISAFVRFLLISYRGQHYYRSIVSYKLSVSGILILLLLSISNVFLANDYKCECVIIILLWILTFVLFRNDLFLIKSKLFNN